MEATRRRSGCGFRLRRRMIADALFYFDELSVSVALCVSLSCYLSFSLARSLRFLFHAPFSRFSSLRSSSSCPSTSTDRRSASRRSLYNGADDSRRRRRRRREREGGRERASGITGGRTTGRRFPRSHLLSPAGGRLDGQPARPYHDSAHPSLFF